jgi:hypothetical protein
LKLAAICSVCAEPFTRHIAQFAESLEQLDPAPVPAGAG